MRRWDILTRCVNIIWLGARALCYRRYGVCLVHLNKISTGVPIEAVSSDIFVLLRQRYAIQIALPVWYPDCLANVVPGC